MREILTSYKEKTETNSHLKVRMSQFCYFRFNFNSLGSFSLHGKISSILILLMLFKTYSKYLSIHKPLAFAV